MFCKEFKGLSNDVLVDLIRIISTELIEVKAVYQGKMRRNIN